jgi:isoquinoline 1-oxidoreductase alpha subunit
MTIDFAVNGRPVRTDAEPDMPLLWVLRDEIGLKGTKFGCGIGMCGACTVHVGGRPTRSCITPISAVEGAEVTTIEGLDPAGSHPVQQAWRELQVPQCGYCQSGQIMQAAGLLVDFPKPTDADIDAVMTGNLCRCMTYARIRDAIKAAADFIARAAIHDAATHD